MGSPAGLGKGLACGWGMKASIPMTRNVTVVPPELTLDLAFKVMERERIRHLPVVRAGALMGILSDRDVLSRARLDEDGILHVPKSTVAGAMTPTPVTAEADTSVAQLVRLMTERKIDAIPIVKGLRLLGLVTSTDLLLLLVDFDEAQPLPFEFRLEETQVAMSA